MIILIESISEKTMGISGENMKKSAKLAIICSVAGICVVLAVVGIIFGVKKGHAKKSDQTNMVVVGFYELPLSQQQVFTNIIEEICTVEEITADFFVIDEEQDFSKQIADNKINLVLAPAGFAVENAVDAAKNDAQVQADVTGGMFSSIRQAIITKDDKLKAVPLIFDNLEIDIEVSAFKISGMERIATWDDIEQFAQIQKKELDFPVSFAAAEPLFLLDLLGALGEAFDGYDEYTKAADILRDAALAKKDGVDFDAATVAKKIFIDPDAPLPYSLYYLKQLVKKGLITPASKELIHTDINSYIQQRVTKAFFTTLSVHRTYDTKAVSRFSTIFIPSKNGAEQRHFTATATYAVPLTENESVSKVLLQLLSTENQTKLSQLTGLAPVLANCRTPDQQADDTRYWIAATNAPVAGLGHEANLSAQELSRLADEIRMLIFY